jgi:hypothetical protein
MTDRIQELMDQCWDSGRGIVNPRKLAYKIIKECAKIARANESEYVRMGRDIDEILLDHFGIAK